MNPPNENIKLIDDLVEHKEAEKLLYNVYKNYSEQDKHLFVIALIGKAVTSSRLLDYKINH